MPTTQQKKEELFDAVAPQKQGPMLVSTNVKKSLFGKLGLLFFLLFLVSAGALAYAYWNFDWTVKGHSVLANDEVLSGDTPVLDRVARLIMLPSFETPSVSTDSAGNTVLVFSKYQIVYSPERDIIVEVRPAAFGSDASASTTLSSAATTGQVAGTETGAVPEFQNTTPIKLEIRNGSGVAGQAAKTRDGLKDLTGYEVGSIGNAAKANHETTMLINLTGRNVEALEKRFNVIAITSLPTEEAGSSADAVIILGKN